MVQPVPDDDPSMPKVIDLGSNVTPFVQRGDGFVKVEGPAGTVSFDFSGDGSALDDEDDDGKFDDNIAIKMDDGELSPIAIEILEGIQQDEDSRREWLDVRTRGISLLGFKIEEPRGEAGGGSAPVEGMSTVRHTLLAEATVSFQAQARGELLPAKGPVKVRSDATPGAPVGMPGSPQGEGPAPIDELAEALEIDLNHYLTVTATEYVPDTDRMLFQVGFGGDGFKKVYHCPLRERPVSESVAAEDLIVSNAATDLQNCGRVTHRIRMRKSVLRRMQLIKAYRDFDLPIPQQELPDPVRQAVADIDARPAEPHRPKDSDYTLYECYVELDLDKFAPKQYKNKKLPLPYVVTIEKTSKKILAIRRNWREDDDLCQARRTFVQFPFIRALGFYGIGFVHLLGNTALALTAAMRLQLDAGMFANFPAFLYAKQLGRQLTNMFRAPPSGGVAIDLPIGAKISDVITPFPYKEVGAAFPAFIQHLEQNAKTLAMASNVQVAEGKQEAPVGTTLALIEQQTKVIASAFKRLHNAQAEEFKILTDLFREDPEAMWRHNPRPARPWTKAQFRAALDKYDLVPVADPNNPTSLHRMAKGALLKSLQTANPAIYDPIAIDRRIMSLAGIDAEGVFKPPTPPQPDPNAAILQAKIALQQKQLEIKQQETQLKALIAVQEQQGKAADRQSREKIEMIKQQISRAKDEQELILEQLKQNQSAMQGTQQMAQSAQQHEQSMTQDKQQHDQVMQQAVIHHAERLAQQQQAAEDKQTSGDSNGSSSSK